MTRDDHPTAQAGWMLGSLFYIEAKANGNVNAMVNKEKQEFGTWKAAERWVENETKRNRGNE